MEKENLKQFTQEKIESVKDFANDKALPVIKETALNTKNKIQEVSKKTISKVKETLNEEQMVHILDTIYKKSVDGIPGVSDNIENLVKDYQEKNLDTEKAVKSLIHNSILKCGTSGFVTSLGGLTTLIAALPANITSVLYVQIRMCCAIAKMGGYDIHSDQVQTMVYLSLTGSAVGDILKQTGIKFGSKLTTSMIQKIPGKALTVINQKVGFRFVTKFGEKGIVNLGKMVPVVGGVIGGGFDAASTKLIGENAYKIFIKGEIEEKSSKNKEITTEENIKETV